MGTVSNDAVHAQGAPELVVLSCGCNFSILTSFLLYTMPSCFKGYIIFIGADKLLASNKIYIICYNETEADK